MSQESIMKYLLAGVITLLLASPFAAIAQDPPSACVEMGGLAWDNWTRSDSGGSGLPAGETDSDYVRCKACHGWDHKGTDGGYVRRSRNSGRPNAGAGDSDQTSRDISYATRGGTPVTAEMIFHSGTGRTFADGSGSWVSQDGMHSSGNKAAHANGYTLGNQHPDFSAEDANALTQQQADCLAEFLNSADAGWDAYFDAIFPDQNPVLYTIRSDADADRGESFYTSSCFGCHGDPATDHQGLNDGHPEGGILAYLASDGKFSEFTNKARWGIPDQVMTRGVMGNPTSLDIADVMLYLQQLGGTGFTITGNRVAGAWADAARDGEGFLVDVALIAGERYLIVSFYTFDSMGNQVWLIGVGKIEGNTATLTIEAPSGAMWGAAFDSADVVKTAWGTAVFTFTSCSSGTMTYTPNAAMVTAGFSEMGYAISRITLPDNACP